MILRRISLFIFCSLLSFASVAQSVAYNPKSTLQNILDTLSLPTNTELIQSHFISSPFAQHYTYDQVTQSKLVKHHGVKIHIKKNGTAVVQNFLNFTTVSSIYTTGDYLIMHNNELHAARLNEIADLRHPVTQYVRQDGLVLMQKDVHKYVRRDTNIFVKVFMVNPINSSGQPYGGSFVDADDQTNSALDSQLFWKEVKAKYSNDSFLLESEFMFFEDVSAPIDTFYYGSNDSLMYTRDIDAFEYLNVYYHINTIGNYVNELGYDTLTKRLKVDVHAFDGWDNSSYTPALQALQFGDGGIDDAEDGEVVVHEYVHSLSEFASPNNTFGAQREAMEEGSCDYFSKAYSRSINDNTDNKVFTWDGNESWNGIKINTDRNYPADLKGNKDGDRDMWSSALMCAHDYIGREAMDSLLIEHFYYQGANTTMTQMAQIILDIDSADFDSRYYSQLKQCFVDAGFVGRGASVKQIKSKENIGILNQQGFAMGTAPLTILAPQIASFSVYNTAGQKLHEEKGATLTLSPANYVPGVYVVIAEIDGKMFRFKIVR